MKNFCAVFALFCVFFIVSCGGDSTSNATSTCSPTSSTPCIDSETEIMWSGKSSKLMHWSEAVDYCEDLNEGGYSDWQLPSIAVLETLVLNVWGEGHSKFGENDFLWSYTHSGSSADGVYFYNGKSESKSVDEFFYARCFRMEMRAREAECIDLPKNAEWNTVSSISQTWSETDSWYPDNRGSFDESPSTQECRFKCKEHYTYDYDQSICRDSNDPPRCTPYNGIPCQVYQDYHWYIWSPRAPNRMSWQEAVNYCRNYSEFGVSDWRLPNINELTSLNDCADSITSCGLSDPNHLSSEDLDTGCGCSKDIGTYAILWHRLGKDDGEASLWSSSVLSDNPNKAWYIYFIDGGIYAEIKSDYHNVRCVRDRK